MNIAVLVGRLTKDADLRYSQSGMAIARFTIAIDRGKDKDGNDRGTDFPNVTVFGKQAENVSKYTHKGSMVAVNGKITTGSYEKEDGTKVYTTEVTANRVKFLSSSSSNNSNSENGGASAQLTNIPEGFEEISEEEIPF